MPSWNIHLAIAKEVNKKLKLDQDAFYFGNTVPDVDYGMNTTRCRTHYYRVNCPSCPKEKLPDINAFLKDYKKKLKNPLVMGMFVHILTDYYYNNEIFSKYWVQDKDHNIIGAKLLNGKITTEKGKYKHHDLELYGKYLFNCNKIEMPSNSKTIYESVNDIKNNCYSKAVIEHRLKYLNEDYLKKNKYTLKEKLFGLHYRMIRKDDLDAMFNGCIDFIFKHIYENV